MTSAPSHLRPTVKKYNSNKPRAEQLPPHSGHLSSPTAKGCPLVATGIARTWADGYCCCSTGNLNIVAVPNPGSVLSKPRPSKPWGCW